MNKLTIYRGISVWIVFFYLVTQAVLTQQWVRSSGLRGDDRVVAVATDKLGNIYCAGYVTSSGNNENMSLWKYNSAGILQWQKIYNGPGNGNDRAFGIVVDADGNIIITGSSIGVGSQSDYTTIKYNAAGTQLWIQRYNTPVNGEDKAFGIAVDRLNNIYVTGYITQLGTGADIFTMKYKGSDGQTIWQQTIANPVINSEDKAFGIAVDSLGDDIYLCGYIQDDTTGFDFTVANYDSTGDLHWINRYNGSGDSTDKAFGIAVDTDEFIYVTGISTGANSREDCMTIKYNPEGDTLWTARYNGPGNHNDKAFGIVVDTDGNPFVTGYTTEADTLSTDYITVKYNTEGVQQWAAAYNGIGNFQDTAYSVCLPKNSEYVFITGGSSGDSVAGKLDAVTIRYNIISGVQSQLSRYNGTDNLNDAGIVVGADTSGNIFTAGYTQTVTTSYDLLLIKYLDGELIRVNMISTEVPKNFSLYQNYPNPFNPATVITFDIQKTAPVKLKIYDMLGREVSVLVNQVLRAGKYEAIFTSSKLASGIYFYELSADNYRETKKMILIK